MVNLEELKLRWFKCLFLLIVICLMKLKKKLAILLNEVEFKVPSIPVIPNVLAEPTSDVETIQDSLINQLTKTVRWERNFRLSFKE